MGDVVRRAAWCVFVERGLSGRAGWGGRWVHEKEKGGVLNFLSERSYKGDVWCFVPEDERGEMWVCMVRGEKGCSM